MQGQLTRLVPGTAGRRGLSAAQVVRFDFPELVCDGFGTFESRFSITRILEKILIRRFCVVGLPLEALRKSLRRWFASTQAVSFDKSSWGRDSVPIDSYRTALILFRLSDKLSWIYNGAPCPWFVMNLMRPVRGLAHSNTSKPVAD